MNREQLLTEMLVLSKRVFELDFDRDEDLAELERIQQRQSDIRAIYDRLSSEDGQEPTQKLRDLAHEITGLETENVIRMQEFKSKLEQTRRDIQSAKRVKNVYENSYIQGFGYFIDSHK
ncbi:hypothetical protein [Cohnella zeiphila]|uniref:Flagellar protein FliT n=1 Tax=Cohnella zeiphila TaxID=2761120 RepID=A0A7X0VW87_9BACL|nr:hypothetical protein [Cohnella zeiphila]MBB6732250.1 hypothetical protein [Cohnella zeiphila]